MEDHTPESLRVARRLRSSMTLPEVMLWRILRNRPEGFKFRRQHPIGPFVADFFCAQCQLVVEIDGVAHDMGDRPSRDAARDAWFDVQGIEVMRIPARDVLSDAVDAAGLIMVRCKVLTPPPAIACATATSPRRGG